MEMMVNEGTPYDITRLHQEIYKKNMDEKIGQEMQLDGPCRAKKQMKSELLNEAYIRLKNTIRQVEKLKDDIYGLKDKPDKYPETIDSPKLTNRPLLDTLDILPKELSESDTMLKDIIHNIREALF